MYNDLIISVDSTTPISQEQMDKYNVVRTDLSYTLDGEHHLDNSADDLEKERFYEKLRAEATVVTDTVQCANFSTTWKSKLVMGKHIIHLSLSSKINGSFDSACLARDALSKDYPGKIRVIDTRSAGPAVAHMALKAAKMYEQGVSLEEITIWLNENNRFFNMIGIIDDLDFFKRSGRISNLSAVVGKAVRLKPILSISTKGGIMAIKNEFGQARANEVIVAMIEKAATDETNWLHIQHGGDNGNALTLVDIVRSRLPFIKKIDISVVSPLLGIHSGPSAVIVSFKGKSRNK